MFLFRYDWRKSSRLIIIKYHLNTFLQLNANVKVDLNNMLAVPFAIDLSFSDITLNLRNSKADYAIHIDAGKRRLPMTTKPTIANSAFVVVANCNKSIHLY